MMTPDELIAADRRALWHPFTQMQAWCDREGADPLIIDRGEGAKLWDIHGNEYIDGNSSIWTNIHGHNHPTINAALEVQLKKIAHCSFLGFTNAPAIELAERLVGLFPKDTLTRVFYSDDGSTAMECALKMAIQFWQHQDRSDKCEFGAFENAYHGDTLGAAALGGIDAFHARFSKFGFHAHHVATVADLDRLDPAKLAAISIEPLIQGAAGMRTWPGGMLRELRAWCDRNDVLLIFDEVMTGFGRTGKMFACEHESVTPDFMALAKGLTGGYLPLGATLTTERVFEAFLGGYKQTFFYGHSYCGNPLGCSAALANLQVFEDDHVLENLQPKIALMSNLLAELESQPRITRVRQCGFIAGIDVDANGSEVCLAAREHGLLTRPILDTIVLMPPLCITDGELRQATNAIAAAC